MSPETSEAWAQDVPSPIDLRTMVDARAWADKAMGARPWRADFFACFAHQLRQLRLIAAPRLSVLELGSGPGFLALHLLGALPAIDYTMLDFSPAMHQLARERLGVLAARMRQVQADFKSDNWTAGLETYDAVVTMQAVHELRHKRYALALHRAVRSLLKPGGRYLVCDHFVGEGGMTNESLYMTVAEQRAALQAAGFDEVTLVLQKGGMVLHSCASNAP